MTASVAGRLRRTVPAEVIARQLDIFDFLRAETPGDPKLTPGRLRRQIEENWAAPAGFVPAAERAAAAEAAERQARERATLAATAAREAATDGAARQATLDALGLVGEDQALWARIAQSNPPLPSLFRAALFHAPREGEAAAVIFSERAALARATGPAHASSRARVAERVAELCGRPGVPVHYLAYDDLLALVREASAPTAGEAPRGGRQGNGGAGGSVR